MKKLVVLVLALCMLLSTVSAFAEANGSEQKVPLISELLADVLEAAENGIEVAAAGDSGRMNIKGGVFFVVKRVVDDIRAFRASKGLAEETEEAAGSTLNIKTIDELKAMIAKMEEFLADDSKPVKDGEPNLDAGLEKANFMLIDLYAVVRENQVITDAIAASGNKLIDTLTDNAVKLKNYLAEKGSGTISEDFPEVGIDAYEAEFASLVAYIQEQDVEKKEQAIALLNLMHTLLDDVHTAIDGHTHDGETAEKTEKPTEMMKKLMEDVLAAAKGVDLDAVETKSEGRMNIAGGIFHVLESVLDDVAESRGLFAKEDMERLVGELKEIVESGKPETADEANLDLMLERAAGILEAAYTAANNNETLMKVIDGTGSVTFAQILSNPVDVKALMMSEEEFNNGIKKEYETMQEALSNLDTKGRRRSQGILQLLYAMFEDIQAMNP